MQAAELAVDVGEPGGQAGEPAVAHVGRVRDVERLAHRGQERLEAADGAARLGQLVEFLLGLDDLLLRLQNLSPTLGFASENREWAREWLADPFTQDALLVQQCVVRMLFALRAMAESRAEALTKA